MKVNGLETLITDVSVAAYDKAVVVVTEQVSEQTRQEDLNQISDYKNWLLQPERKTSKEMRTFAARHFDGLAANIRKLAAVVVSKVKDTMMRPEVRNANVEAVKETARESILGKLKKKEDEVKRRD